MDLFGNPETTHRQVVALPVTQVQHDPEQPRKSFRSDALDALAESIKKEGLLQPIAVRPDPAHPGHFIIIGGERRWRAHQIAGFSCIDAEIHVVDEKAVRRLALLENLNREDLNVMEEVAGVKQLLDLGYPVEEVGRSIGKKPATLETEQRLLGLDPAVRDLVRQGQISRMIALRLTQLSANGQVKALRLIGGKDNGAAGAMIDALVAQEHQRDLFAEALEDAHGNKILAVARRWERFLDAARCLVKSLISPDDYRLIPAAVRVDLNRNVAELDVTIKSLERIKREMLRFQMQRRRA
jgi:ParB/RepB/Spo0J family partition protein